MEKAIKEVMRVIYELDKSEFHMIGYMLDVIDGFDESKEEEKQSELRSASSGE